MAYVDRDKVLEELNKVPAYFESGDIRYGIEIAIDTINKQPTADVVEVKHSQWVVEAYDNQDNIVVIPYIEHQHCEPFCLICGKRALLNGAEDYVTSNYCPNCGAKMDLVVIR